MTTDRPAKEPGDADQREGTRKVPSPLRRRLATNRLRGNVEREERTSGRR